MDIAALLVTMVRTARFVAKYFAGSAATPAIGETPWSKADRAVSDRRGAGEDP
jgi:hypothetical protein